MDYVDLVEKVFAVAGVVAVALATVAPYTKTKVDDEAASWLHRALDFAKALYEARGGQGGIGTSPVTGPTDEGYKAFQRDLDAIAGGTAAVVKRAESLGGGK